MFCELEHSRCAAHTSKWATIGGVEAMRQAMAAYHELCVGTGSLRPGLLLLIKVILMRFLVCAKGLLAPCLLLEETLLRSLSLSRCSAAASMWAFLLTRTEASYFSFAACISSARTLLLLELCFRHAQRLSLSLH